MRRPPASLAALAVLVALCAATPSYKSAPDGPSKLDDCGCWPIYQRMLTCQKLNGPNSGIKECACIPNPDGWYTSMNGCRACLSPGSYDVNDFFDNLSRTITQLFVSCTETGGGIKSDGQSICASNYYFRACASLRTGGEPSWASYEVFDGGKGGNGTFVLDIAEYQANATATDTAVSKTTTTRLATSTGTLVASETSTAVGTSAPATRTSDAATTTATTSAPSSTTSSSSAMGCAESRSQAGCMILGAVMAAGIGAVLF